MTTTTPAGNALESWDRCESNHCPHCVAGHPEPDGGLTLDGIFELDEPGRRALPPGSRSASWRSPNGASCSSSRP